MRMPDIIFHADWGKDPAKRWGCALVPRAGRWWIETPAPVGDTGTLIDRLAARGRVVAGFDFPFGLPAAYARAAGFTDFRAALAQLGRGAWTDWFTPCDTKDQITLQRPFFPARPAPRGMIRRDDLPRALGLHDYAALLRACDRKTTDCPEASAIFWTMGGKQVGKAAIAGWRDMLIPARDRVALWPFDGTLADLTQGNRPVICETYPALGYRLLGLPANFGKRRQEGIARVAPALLAWIDAQGLGLDGALRAGLIAGLPGGPEREDKFDALIGALQIFGTLRGLWPPGPETDPDIRRYEGWILGRG